MGFPVPPQRTLVLYCPGWEGDPAETRDFGVVVDVVEDFCPKVEVLRPGTCAIGVRGPARYFGGEQELARKISAAIRELGADCRVGIADGLFAAELAARSEPAACTEQAAGAELADRTEQAARTDPGGLIIPPGETLAFLAGQPVGVLGSPELDYLLPRLGITTLGEFAALPAPEAASRFGAAGALAHRLASGLEPRPLVPRAPVADLSVRCEFDPPAEQAEPVVFAAKALAGELHGRLASGGLACVRVRVLVRGADGRESSRLWRHDGLLSDLAVAERVRWQLDGWPGAEPGAGPPGAGPPGARPGAGPGGHQRADLRQDPRGSGQLGDRDQDEGGAGEGIVFLALIPDQLVRATGRQLGLWGDAVVSDRVARAAIRVQAMLGHDAVTRPVLAGGRTPAEQALLVPFGDAAEPERPADRPWPGALPAPAPATVYPQPLPAEVTDASGAGVTVTGRARLSAPPAWLSVNGSRARAVTAWAGPWPIAERWWDPARARRQARFQLVTDDGAAWLAVLQDGRWLALARYD